MEIQPLEVYSQDSNFAVIKPPGRNYPGAVIQGDSLAILSRTALRCVERLQQGDPSSQDFLGDLEDLTNSLLERMLHYQAVLESHGIDLPYTRPFSSGDLVKLVADEDA